VGIVLVVVIVVVAGLAVLLYVNLSTPRHPGGLGGPPGSPGNYTVISYTSTVDSYPLSYDEWLPSGYSSQDSYPLIIYLHGQQDTSGAWFPGGLTSDLVLALTGPPADRMAADALVNASQAQGAILMAINTRSGSGWYINSPCGGPQQQDVLDAIHHEMSLRHVTSLYLMGESMGTEGTLYTASQHPGMFAGIAVIAPVTDLFEDVAYRIAIANNPNEPWAEVSIQAKAHLFCGSLPGTANASQVAVARVFQNMSPLRFNPTAFQNVAIYLTSGGVDDRAPNNVSIWADWMNANNTFVNATCHYAPELGEPVPPSCSSQTMESFHRQDPSAYRFRYIFEPHGAHSISQLNPSDLFAFWFDGAAGGYYLGAPLSTVVTPAPGLSY
jgi:pimeloyl-ACP methyl ester carboxylesterase